ncbi:hypothetical protein JCGZ_16536 [Jatropha curcas]|uniref:SAUR family protein n=1 Tax=Jatropha curcas TaxID=180498 RepID=A0A067JZ24_JATCU|nr:hypothetical protein JCGZ_16536 [Jatropha curcas]
MAMKTKKESVKGLMMLKLFIRKLQQALLLSSSKESSFSIINEEIKNAKEVPGDVKQGQFAVLAVKGEEPKRFVVELDHLTNPEFMKLLEQAQEEFGFQQKGVLAVPCQPEELQTILSNRKNRRISTEW